MQNLSKIDSAKDLVTKEWVEAQDFLPSSAFTKTGIKNALGISDWALAASKPSYDDVYLKLAGGTISGALLVNSTLTTSGSIYCNANIKINAGGKLILGNDEGITSWSDLKSKIAYSFSEISNKPTTLSGYGITDAVRYETGITPTASPNVMGYAGGGEGWPVGGPVMVWGTGSYVARLCVNIWETNPTMLISCLAGADATEWATFVTSLNVGQYAMKVESGILSGANLNELMTPGSYNNWASVSNSPTSAESTILVISSKTNYMTSQILTDAQGHLYSRMNEGGTWRNWRTILDTDNIGTTSLPSLNLNGEPITSWDNVRHRWTYRITATWNADINVKRYEHIGISGTLTASSSPVTFNIENVSPVSSVVVFRTGNTLPTVKFKYGGTEGAIKWEDGIDITRNLSVNTGYRIEFDGNFAMVRMFK